MNEIIRLIHFIICAFFLVSDTSLCRNIGPLCDVKMIYNNQTGILTSYMFLII